MRTVEPNELPQSILQIDEELRRAALQRDFPAIQRLLSELEQAGSELERAYCWVAWAWVLVLQSGHNAGTALVMLQQAEPLVAHSPGLHAQVLCGILYLASRMADRYGAQQALYKLATLRTNCPDHPEVVWWWGQAFYSMGQLASRELRHAEAIAWFRSFLVILEESAYPEKAIWVPDAMAGALSYLAYHLSAVGEGDEACITLRRAMEWTADHSIRVRVMVYYHGAEVMWAAGDVRSARRYLVHARRIGRREPDLIAHVYWLAARMAWLTGCTVKALRRIDRGRRSARRAYAARMMDRFNELESFVRAGRREGPTDRDPRA